jgi:hypothetical protein
MLDGFWVTGSGGASASYTIPSPTGSGTTYYVSPDGNDLSAGTSASTAWATLTKAVATATTAGDVVIIRAGVYDITATVSPGSSGSSGSPITFIAESEGVVTFDGDHGVATCLTIEEVEYLNFYGFKFINFTDWAIDSSAVATTQTSNIGLYYCTIAQNGRTPRRPQDSSRYGGVRLNENTVSWTIDACKFFSNCRIENPDFDGESSANNSQYRLDASLRIGGCLHSVASCTFAGNTTGYHISINGHWDHTSLSAGEYAVSVDSSYFVETENGSPYADVHGVIEVLTDAASHGSYSHVFPKIEVTGCTAEASAAGSGTDTFIGIYNDVNSYGPTSIAHSLTNNLVEATSLYNEGEAWLASHSAIVATGNTTSATISDDAKKLAQVAAICRSPISESAPKAAKWTPFHVPAAYHWLWIDASNPDLFTLSGSNITAVDSQFYETRQYTSSNNPTYNSGVSIEQVDSANRLDLSGVGTSDPDIYRNDLMVFWVGSAPNITSTSYLFRIQPASGSLIPGVSLGIYSSNFFFCIDADTAISTTTRAEYDAASYVADTKIMLCGVHRAAVTSGTPSGQAQIYYNGLSTSGTNTNLSSASTANSNVSYLHQVSPVGTLTNEMIVLKTARDDIRLMVEGYLASKHSLSLPAAHPYASVAPKIVEV